VRNLAEQSAGAAREAGSLLVAISSQVTELAGQMARGEETVQGVEHMAESAATALEDIVASSRDAGGTAQNIGRTAGQQEHAFAKLQEQIGHLAVVSARIREETTTLAAQAGRAASGQAELEGAIRQLEQVATHLQAIARHFTVGS
jgi:methyl-accepting chemotaxis protein